MAATFGSEDIPGNVICRPTPHELTSVSRGRLNRLGQSWTRLKATLWAHIKFKCIMAPTSGFEDMDEKVTYMPTLPGEKNLSIEFL